MTICMVPWQLNLTALVLGWQIYLGLRFYCSKFEPKPKCNHPKCMVLELSSVRFAPICVLFGKGDTKEVTRGNSMSPHVQVLDKGGVGSSTI